MLGSLEDSGVRCVSSGSENNLGSDALRMGHLGAVLWHAVTSVVERKVHVLGEEGQELGALEPLLDSLVLDDVLPELALLARSRLRKVLRGVELGHVRERTWCS